MAQLALAVAGAAVGGLVGGPVGASIGWSLGSVVGSALFAPTTKTGQQPVDDLRYLDSSYGAPLHLHYGVTAVSAANVIWASDFRAIQSTQTSGGKGGPKVETTTYSYEIDLAIALSGRQSVGIGRIWIDNVVRYDGRADAGVEAALSGGGLTLMPDGSYEISGVDWCSRAVFYPGSDTQLPDPVMEAALGTANTPAFRGTCYLMIEALACGSSTRVPQIVIELYADGTRAEIGVLWETDTDGEEGFGWDVRPFCFVEDGLISLSAGDLIDETKGFAFAHYDERPRCLNFVDGTVLPPGPGKYFEYPPYPAAAFDNEVARYYPFVLGSYKIPLYLRAGDNTQTGSRANIAVFGQLASPPNTPVEGWSMYLGTDVTNFIRDGNSTFLGAAGSVTGEYLMVFYNSNNDGSGDPTHWTMFACGPPLTLAEDPQVAGRVWRGEVDTWEGPQASGYTASASASRGSAVIESDLRHIWTMGNTGGTVYLHRVTYDPDEDKWKIGFVDNIIFSNVNAGDIDEPSATSGLWADKGFVIAHAWHTKIGLACRFNGLVPDSPTVAEVLTDIYDRTGYDATEDLNVASLTATVDGFEFVSPGIARDAFEVLANGYLFDCVESDGKIKGVYRGSASAASIEADDLVGGQSARIEEERQHESEIPYRVSVRYVSKNADYRRGAQTAENAVTQSNDDVTVDLPLVITDDRAAELADILRRDRWRARTTVRLSTSRKWLKLEPTDVVNVDDGEIERKVRLVGARHTGALLSFDAVSDGAAFYSSGAVGGAVPVRPVDPTSTTFSGSAVLDIPALEEEDDTYRVEIAASPTIPGSWPGAVAFTSPDGSQFSAGVAINQASVIGAAWTALPDWAGGVMIDESSTLQVGLYNEATLSSTDNDGLLELENLAAVRSGDGWEIIAFRDVTQVVAGSYVLSGLLRGLAGTESMIAGHAAGDTFVLLERGKYVQQAMSAIYVGHEFYFRVPTAGKRVADAQTHEIDFLARSLRPLPPVHVAVSRVDPSSYGDIQISWTRRGRIDHVIRDYWSATLDEPAERYEVDIYDNYSFDNVVRTIECEEASCEYSMADQIADFPAARPIAELYARIYQISSRVGRGDYAEVDLPIAITPAAHFRFNGTNGSTTFTDEAGGTYSRVGTPTISTAQSRFDGASGIFSGSQCIKRSHDNSLELYDHDFTIACWVYPTNTQTNNGICGKRTDTIANGFDFSLNSARVPVFRASTNGTSFNYTMTGTGAASLNAWTHLALCRRRGTLYLFINGALDKSQAIDITVAVTESNSFNIGSQVETTSGIGIIGHLDEFIFYVGRALYTEAFNPPSSRY